MDNTYSGLAAAVNPRADPTDGFAIGFVTALEPLTVQMGDQTYYGDEITASHAHDIPQTRVKLIIHSPLRTGQRVLILPKADQQSIYLVDILP